MLGNYITKDNLPGDLLGNLEAVTINAGSSFLSGQATSAFAKPAEIANNAMLSVNTVTDKALIDKLSKQLIEHAITVTTNEILTYLSDKTTELLDFEKITNVLAESTAYWTQAKMMTPAQIFDTIKTKNLSEENKKQMEETTTSGISNAKETLSNAAGTIKEYSNRIIDSLDAGLGTITAYITNGPDWVISKTNTYVALAIDKAKSFIGEQVNTAIKGRDSIIDALGQSVGAGTAEIVNQKTLSAAKKTKSDTEGAIASAQVTATNLVIKAVMKVRQLTGVAIPLPEISMPSLSSLF